MITFQNMNYELFFSNKLPLLLALNYTDELFFTEFDKLLGKKYRILSIIKEGWQKKYGKSDDVEELKKHFETKIDDFEWSDNLFSLYEEKSKELRAFLDEIKEKDYSKVEDQNLTDDIKDVRNKSAVLDAMTNMLHLS